MGSATQLDYRHRRGNPFQRGVQATASTRPGAWVFAHLLPPLDRVTNRVTKGRTTLPAVLAGLPTLWVTTTGRRSGQRRTTPLIAVPVGNDLALLGTNFGQPSTPAWVLNLEADPRASIDYEGRRCEVVARPATDDERSLVWAASSAVYGGYQKYRSRVTRRDIRIFVLEPAADGPAPDRPGQPPTDI